ncbi:MAG: hypothetical protein ACYCOY_08720 [Metallibacterium sp.]
MRALTLNEMEAVGGGNPAAVIVVGGVALAAAAVGVVAYAAYKGCNATMSAGKDGVKLEVQCKK